MEEDQIKKVEHYFRKVGSNCPYNAARNMGVKISHIEDLGDQILGLYQTTAPGIQRIYINCRAPIEIQDDACYHLICHHASHKGIEKVLTVQDLESDKKMQKAVSRFKEFLKNTRILALITARQ